MKLFEALRGAVIKLRTSSLRGAVGDTAISGSRRDVLLYSSKDQEIASSSYSHPANTPRNDSVLDARLLLQHLLGMSHEELIINDQSVLNAEELDAYQKLLARRANQEPIAYITSSKEFFSRDFYVNPHVLIPRSDTETLVEEALLFLRKKPMDAKILDLGTGSGCIIISLLCELQNARGVAVDISPNALSVARINAEKYGLQTAINLREPSLRGGRGPTRQSRALGGMENKTSIKNAEIAASPCSHPANTPRNDVDMLMLLESNWFANIHLAPSPQKFDLIISNPPYIAEGDDMVSLETSKHEPKISLYADENGLYAYKTIASRAREYLNTDGRIIVEIGINQEKDVIEIFESQGFECKKMVKDLSGIVRCLVF